MSTVNYEKQIMQHYLIQIIKNLKNAGIEDITTEDVTVSHPQRGKLKVRFYNESSWVKNPEFKATTAQIVMNQAFKGCKVPDHVVGYKNKDGEVETFLVKVIK